MSMGSFELLTKMLINKNTKIIGNKCILVPYREEHVPKYHFWMQSPELQALTASEPLSLQEEYEMQKSWMHDINKCTFIILDKEKYACTSSEIDSMIGDTNLFFANGEDSLCAEAEIMIAEGWARGRKCGTEAMLLMFLYGIDTLDVKQFVVKIGETNTTSLNMFRKFGFIDLSYSRAFQEVTLSKLVDESWTKSLREIIGDFTVVNKD